MVFAIHYTIAKNVFVCFYKRKNKKNKMDIENINFIYNDDGFVEYMQQFLSQWCNNTIILRLYSYKNIPKEELEKVAKINHFKDTMKLEEEVIDRELEDITQVKMFALYNNDTIVSTIHFQKIQNRISYISNTPAVYGNKKLNTVLRCVLVLYIYLAMPVSVSLLKNNYLISQAINPASANILVYSPFLFGEKDIYYIEGYERKYITQQNIQEYCRDNNKNKNECMQYLFQQFFNGILYIQIECHYENAKIALQLLEQIIRDYDTKKCISSANGGKRRSGKKHTRRRQTKKTKK